MDGYDDYPWGVLDSEALDATLDSVRENIAEILEIDGDISEEQYEELEDYLHVLSSFTQTQDDLCLFAQNYLEILEKISDLDHPDTLIWFLLIISKILSTDMGYESTKNTYKDVSKLLMKSINHSSIRMRQYAVRILENHIQSCRSDRQALNWVLDHDVLN